MYVVIEFNTEYGGCCFQQYVYKVFGPFSEVQADYFVDNQGPNKGNMRIEKLEEPS